MKWLAVAVLFLGLFKAQNVVAEQGEMSWGAIKANQPAAKLVVTARPVAGEREELIFRGTTEHFFYRGTSVKRFDSFRPFVGDVVIGLGLDLPVGKYRAFTFRYTSADGETTTARSKRLPRDLDANGELYVIFEWLDAGGSVEADLTAIGVATPGYLEIYGIR